MRVISGKAGSLPLQVPQSLTRPTTDRVREAVFSSLGELVVDASVLDLFAGSGALGIEALSRGAREVIFVENNREAIQVIKKNLVSTNLSGGVIREQHVASFLSYPAEAAYSIIFADPPYAKKTEELAALEEFLSIESLARCLSKGGLLILESYARHPLPDSPLWEIVREKTYGKTRVSYLRHP